MTQRIVTIEIVLPPGNWHPEAAAEDITDMLFAGDETEGTVRVVGDILIDHWSDRAPDAAGLVAHGLGAHYKTEAGPGRDVQGGGYSGSGVAAQGTRAPLDEAGIPMHRRHEENVLIEADTYISPELLRVMYAPNNSFTEWKTPRPVYYPLVDLGGVDGDSTFLDDGRCRAWPEAI